MIKNLNFSSSGRNYTATQDDIFMANGVVTVFIKGGKNGDPKLKRQPISQKEWERLLPSLAEMDYEQYYGRKPLLAGVSIFRIK